MTATAVRSFGSSAVRHLLEGFGKMGLDGPLLVDPADPVPEPEDVPAAFLEHGVLVWRDSLESV